MPKQKRAEKRHSPKQRRGDNPAGDGAGEGPPKAGEGPPKAGEGPPKIDAEGAAADAQGAGVPLADIPVGDGEGPPPETDDMTKEEKDLRAKAIEITSATGVSYTEAVSALKHANNDQSRAIGEIYAHKNRVAKGWIKEEAIKRNISEAQGKMIVWIDLIGGEEILYGLDRVERSNPLNHWFQVIIEGPFGQTFTSKAVRRGLTPMWKEQVPFVVPITSVVYLRVTIVTLLGDPIATGEAKLPIKRSGTIASDCPLVAARPGAKEGSCGRLLVTASSTRLGPTSIVSFANIRRDGFREDVDFDASFLFDNDVEYAAAAGRLPRAPMRTISGPARAGEVMNPILGPDLDALQDEFEVRRTKTADRVRMSAAQYTIADDSNPASSDLLLRLLHRRLASKKAEFAGENRVDTKGGGGALSMCCVCHKATSLDQDAPQLNRSCGHTICATCLSKHVTNCIQAGKATNVVCPEPSCTDEINPVEIQRTLTERDYDLWETACLSEFLGKTAVGRCPKCFVTFTVDTNRDLRAAASAAGIDTAKKVDNQGKPIMSAAALKHYNKNRIRCAECNTSFCYSCQASPFHAGYDTCDAFALATSGRSCRWCEQVLTDDNIWKNYMCKGAIKNTCREADCIERAKTACLKTHACGHNCGGIKDEKKCFPCLECKEIKDVEPDAWCTICYSEGLNVAPSVQLKCGHLMHAHCVKKVLEKRWGDQARIEFGFMNCPECRAPIEHEGLDKDFIKPMRELKEHVDKLLDEQMKIEYPLLDAEEKEKADKAGHKEYAEMHLSFELCHKCKLPYFAGRVDCAQGVDADGPPPAKAEDAVCAACRDLDGLDSLNGKPCPKHGKEALVWKCRYGCHLATYECFNYLHVCTPCHGNEILCKFMDFNTRVGGGHPRRGGVPGDDKVYSNKMDIWEYPQCPGPDECPLGCVHPPTGIEFCFGCSMCKDEMEVIRKHLEPLRPVFLRIALEDIGHLKDYEEKNNEETEARLMHSFWLIGRDAIKTSRVSKREAIHCLQFLMELNKLPLDKYSVKLKGSIESLRRGRSLADIVSAHSSWRLESSVLERIEKTSCFALSVTREAANPLRPLFNVAVRYVAKGVKLPEDVVPSSATVNMLVRRLVDTAGITKEEASSIDIFNGDVKLDRDDKLLPLFQGPELVLSTKMGDAASAKISDCIIS